MDGSSESRLAQRRAFLVRALSTGLLVGGAAWNRAALASWFGKMPRKMPEGQSVFDLQGNVRVDGRPAGYQTPVGAESRIETDAGSYIIVAVGDGAYLIRERSILELSGKELLVRSLRLISGALLSVVGTRPPEHALTVHTPIAVMGIRGTGFYIEADAEKTYFCTCYGHTTLDAGNGEVEDLVSLHHDVPRLVVAAAEPGKRIGVAPVKDHTDLELMTLEALCGREVPFASAEGGLEGSGSKY
jgi:hypothetical protein